MKRNIFIALAAFAICSSCSDSYYLPETEQDLAQLSGIALLQLQDSENGI